MKKVLVIGGYSQYGPAVIQHLLEKGIEVVGFDRLRMPQDYPGYEGEDRPKVTRFLGDVRDAVAVNEALSIADGVIHLGSMDDPAAGFLDQASALAEYNLIGTLNVFQACRFQVKRCVYLVPNSHFEASELAFQFNAEADTEIAVVKEYAGALDFPDRALSREDIARGIVEYLLADHFQYQEPFTFVVSAPQLQEATT